MIEVPPAPVAQAPAPAEAHQPARALAERRLAMLTRLAEIGMEIAEVAGRQATSGAGEGAHLRDPALAYARAARAVRMTLFLQSRLAGELAGLERAEARAEAERKIDRRKRLHRLVERALDEDGPEDEDLFERLSSEARERLTDAAEDAELEGLSFAEIVGRICGDLGLTPEWTARLVAAVSENAARPCEGGDPGVLSKDGVDAEKAWVPAFAAMSGSREARAPPPA